MLICAKIGQNYENHDQFTGTQRPWSVQLAYYSNNMKKTKKDFNDFNHVYTLNFDMQKNTS